MTIDALVKLVAEPENEVITGWQGKIANVLHHLMPHAVERLMAKNTEAAQFGSAPPTPITSDSIHRPSGK